MSPLFKAFSEEVKIAATRSVREARKALEAGDINTAQEIADAYKRLGASPRYLKDITATPGEIGMEGPLDLLMGAYKGGPERGGLIARKLHDPFSSLARGDLATKNLELRKQVTDIVRKTPEGKAIVPEMFGYDVLGDKKQISKFGPRHISYYEYVPNLKQEPISNLRNIPDYVRSAVSKIQDSLKGTNYAMDDIITKIPFAGDIYNPGNVGRSSGKTKIVDFIPRKGNVIPTSMGRQILKDVILGRPKTTQGINAVRKEVFNPQQAIPMIPNKLRAALIASGILAGAGALAYSRTKKQDEAQQ